MNEGINLIGGWISERKWDLGWRKNKKIYPDKEGLSRTANLKAWGKRKFATGKEEKANVVRVQGTGGPRWSGRVIDSCGIIEAIQKIVLILNTKNSDEGTGVKIVFS